MSYYQERIRETAKKLGRPKVDARLVEAWMRVEHDTLDALGGHQWIEEVRTATGCVDDAAPSLSERLARSYGL